MKKLWLLPVGLVVLLLTILLFLAVMPGSWIVPRLESVASELTGTRVSIGDLELDLLSATPGVTLSSLSVDDVSGDPLVDAQEISAAVDAGELLSGDLVFERIAVDSATLKLRTDANGNNNWDHLLAAGDTRVSGTQETPARLPAVRLLDLKEITLDYQNTQMDLSVDLMVNASGSTLADETDSTLRAAGSINGQTAELHVQTDYLQSLNAVETTVALDARLLLGDTVFKAVGDIGDPTVFRDLDLMVSLEAPALDDLAELIDVPLPVIPPYVIAGSLKRDGNDLILRRFEGVLGDSDIEGDIRLDLETTPVTLYANVISRILDLDDLAGLIGAPADVDETAIADERLPPASASGALLPDQPLNLQALAESFTGAIRYRARQVRSPVWPVDAIDVRIEMEPDRLVLSPMKVGLAGGKVDLSLIFELDQALPAATIEARISQVELKRVMSATGIDDDSFGILGGRLKFWMDGQTVSELAASADGGIFLLMTQGRLDALLAEIAGVDLFESISLLLDPEKTRTDIRCAYLDLHADNGVAEFNRFVMDTDDTVFLAEGSLDFNNESLDLIMEPHPKDVSLIAAQTAINIGGTFRAPTALPGKALAGRAVLAALASIASPAAALLPLVQPGIGQDSPFCEGLIEAIDDAR